MASLLSCCSVSSTHARHDSISTARQPSLIYYFCHWNKKLLSISGARQQKQCLNDCLHESVCCVSLPGENEILRALTASKLCQFQSKFPAVEQSQFRTCGSSEFLKDIGALGIETCPLLETPQCWSYSTQTENYSGNKFLTIVLSVGLD